MKIYAKHKKGQVFEVESFDNSTGQMLVKFINPGGLIDHWITSIDEFVSVCSEDGTD